VHKKNINSLGNPRCTYEALCDAAWLVYLEVRLIGLAVNAIPTGLCGSARCGSSRTGWLSVVLVAGMFWVTAGIAQEDGLVQLGNEASFQAEIANVRALPPGYTAMCNYSQLELRSAHSATLLIRNSGLCAFWMEYGEFQNDARFTVCSNDPLHKDPAGQLLIPVCADLPRTYHGSERKRAF